MLHFTSCVFHQRLYRILSITLSCLGILGSMGLWLFLKQIEQEQTHELSMK